MAYSIREDINKMAGQRRLILNALANETDEEKIETLRAGLDRFDAKVDSYYDVQGSDGSAGTTMYAEGMITWTSQFLGGL